MSESFDPYRQWLGIDEPHRPLNHYQLLGLAPFETDLRKVSHAADIAMAKVRKIRPGGRVSDWGRLLDQLGQAKDCLLHPDAKAAYDAGLRTQAAPTLNVKKSPSGAGSASGPVMAVPPTMSPEPSYVDSPWSPGLEPSPAPGQEGMPTIPAGQPIPVATAVPTSARSMVTVAVVLAEQPAGKNLLPSFPDGSTGEVSGLWQPRRRRSVWKPVLIVSSVVLTFGAVVLVLALLMRGQEGTFDADVPQASPRPTSSPRVIDESPAVPVAEAASEAPPEALPEIPKDDPSPPATETGVPPANAAGASDNMSPPASEDTTDQSPAGSAVNNHDDSGESVEALPPTNPAPDGNMSGTEGGFANDSDHAAVPSTEPSEASEHMNSPISAVDAMTNAPGEQTKAGAGNKFAAAVAGARLAIAERDLSAAHRHVATADSLARTDEQRETVERIRIVLEHVVEFWEGMHEAVATLESGQELRLRDTIVIVVESSRDALLIRSAGRQRPFRTKELPGGLVLAIAKARFDAEEASSKLLIGVFLAFDREGDADLGRQLLNEATLAGLDSQPFLTELESGDGAQGKTR